MALRKTFGKLLLNSCRLTSPSVTLEHSQIHSPSLTQVPPNATKPNFHREYLTSPDSGDKGFFRRFLHRRALNQSATRLPEFLSLPLGDKLKEKLRGINNSGDRIRLDGLAPPEPDPPTDQSLGGISVKDARKLLRLAQVEKLKAKLREIPKGSISYSEFIQICVQGCEREEQGVEFAKILDESGNVIVLGNTVFLRPEQVAKSMETLISQSIIVNPNDPRRKELEQLEMQKAIIDKKAKAHVQRELYCGMGLIVIQTLGFMRLTFWELTWDVMEPICFFAASLNFFLGYAFFLRTSTEPSFEGYYKRRFNTKQRKLMAINNFDIQKYNQLRQLFYPNCNYGMPNSHYFSSFNHEERGISRTSYLF